MKKERFDKYLVDHGFFDSREKAKKAIMAGLVMVSGQVKDKAGEQLAVDLDPSVIEIKGNPIPYVSRGGLKLEKGLAVFSFPVKDGIFLDIGASTGGFTDCLLQNGAAKVYSVDVGYGQLDWRLRGDERVVSMERTNFRNLEKDAIPDNVDGTVMDVSFISITKLLDAIRLFLKDGGKGIWLIKPQFEAGRDKVGKNGVVRDKKIHREVLDRTLMQIMEKHFKILGLDYSPIQGPKGNIEFLCYVEKLTETEIAGLENREQLIEQVVNAAHSTYSKKDGESNDE
ncbi:TlyA family RNA methyltransferase [Eubacterium limosum]|uniref:TlyA family RNA methyltransferase n=1 Tax=Eubacterium limosum TaxID=1736 RepID=A0ABT5ULB8_EUBLI|nr:TlyA family RNA methyltransferase [Eubacterium limosum]MCB6571436.1 TlyA family RNA methyltransferase [Eubacterium limosum]MDE1469693.1 TlyA family RNA methyltransferase [Eubacterium limosum]